MHLQLLILDMHDYVPEDVKRATIDGLEAWPFPHIGKPVSGIADIAFGSIHLARVVVSPKDIVPIEVVRASAYQPVRDGIAVSRQPVMRHNVPMAVNANAVDARQSTSLIGKARLRPGDSALHDVVGDIEIGLHRHAGVRTHNAIIGVAEMETAEHIGGCRIKGPNGANRVLDGQVFHMDIAAVNFQDVTPLAVPTVQNREVSIGAIDESVSPADHNWVLKCAAASNLPVSAVSACVQCNDIPGLFRAKGAGQLRRGVHINNPWSNRVARNGSRYPRES